MLSFARSIPGGDGHAFAIGALLLALVLAVLALIGFRHLASSAWGRVSLLAATVLVPVSVSTANLGSGVVESSRTRFCLQCHEMGDHGRSLFVDEQSSLAAVHYQNRLVDRDGACFACHTDYAMFGDVKAKISGLRHVYVHYLGTVPKHFELYKPYANHNCLHCHEDARRFTENVNHRSVMTKLQSGETSCLSCHNVAHDLQKVQEGVLWRPQ